VDAWSTLRVIILPNFILPSHPTGLKRIDPSAELCRAREDTGGTFLETELTTWIFYICLLHVVLQFSHTNLGSFDSTTQMAPFSNLFGDSTFESPYILRRTLSAHPRNSQSVHTRPLTLHQQLDHDMTKEHEPCPSAPMLQAQA
jgi:hypothetical protein